MLGEETTFAPFVPQPAQTAPVSITPGASPYTYTATEKGAVFVAGGTVSLVEYGRAGVFTDTGVIAGMFEISAGDALRVTSAVDPTMTFLAR